ncbi:unnamed protein product [marine sediment metagenome]|uniref:DUF551 domain-containing protein n=1 Tax=marine sediment metagenome TaxID=412755 RepID=X0VX15_9ZZZZ
MNNEWNDPKTAPKDKPVILNVGLPWSVVGVWNEPIGQWTYSSYQIGMLNGEFNDTYFENEYSSTILGWQDMPELS